MLTCNLSVCGESFLTTWTETIGDDVVTSCGLSVVQVLESRDTGVKL